MYVSMYDAISMYDATTDVSTTKSQIVQVLFKRSTSPESIRIRSDSKSVFYGAAAAAVNGQNEYSKTGLQDSVQRRLNVIPNAINE